MNPQEILRECEAYAPPLTRRPDFDLFWEETRRQAHTVPLEPQRTEKLYPTRCAKVFEISYNGFDHTRISGWLILPTWEEKKRFPCLIHYPGFNGNRGNPAEFMHWISLGVAVLSIDCREQGGITGNQAAYNGSGLFGGCVSSKGILDKNQYYYRAVYMDCLKAIDFVESCPELDCEKIILHGSSQGGGLVLAVCGLDSRAKIGIANVPSNSNLELRVEGRYGSFTCINDYLRRFPDNLAQAYETLSYFDTMNMADKISCQIFASVGLADPICPAKCAYATFNRIESEKHIIAYPFSEHDGARHIHTERELQYVYDSGILET